MTPRPAFMGIGKYLVIMKVSFQNKVVYMADALLGSIFLVLILFIFSEIWKAASRGGFVLSGFGPRELVWYMVATETIMLSRARMERDTDEEVKTGAIAYMLNKPYHYVLYRLAVYYGDTAFRFLIHLTAGSLVATVLVGPLRVHIGHMPQVLLTVVFAFTMNFFINMCISLAAFVVEDTKPFFWIYSKLLYVLGGLFVPVDIYPEFLRRIAAATPFNYVLYGPARLFVEYEPALLLSVLANQALWTVVLGGLVFSIYSAGVRRLNVNGG